MSHYLATPHYTPQMDTSCPEAGSSKLVNAAKAMPVEENDPDELVWLGGVHSPAARPQEAHDHVEDIWCRDEWDCPTDILYHHAENEDHVKVAPVALPVQTAKVIIKPSQQVHPMFNHPLYFASSVRGEREAHDPATWDSPTDILYSHAEHDEPDITASALGIHLDVHSPPAVFSPSPIHLSPAALNEVQVVRRNAFGVAREPYKWVVKNQQGLKLTLSSAATWDSPTDILYAHQSHEEEEHQPTDVKGHHGNGEESENDGPASPHTPYSAFIATPVDSDTFLPIVSGENSEISCDRSEVGDKATDKVDDLVLRANLRLAAATFPRE